MHFEELLVRGYPWFSRLTISPHSIVLQVSLAGGKGVKVAIILETPRIKQADMHIYTTHTRRFPVRGIGFVSVQDPGKPPIVVVDGISSVNFKVQVRV